MNLSRPQPQRITRTEALADFFRMYPDCWHDGRTLAAIAGAYAWRTRCSEIRRAPWSMRVINRQRHVRVDGRPFTISEYKFISEAIKGQEAADDVCASSAAV